MAIQTVGELIALLQAKVEAGEISESDEVCVWANVDVEEPSLVVDGVSKDAVGNVWIDASE